MRNYKCLSKAEFFHENYKVVPIRDEDKYLIMDWRNEQIVNLRQKLPLTKEQQDLYFATVVADLFTQEQPEQLLFSFLKDEIFIGYGGLVHIDWENKNSEISFLIKTDQSVNEKIWADYFSVYIEIIKSIAKYELNLKKIYTYTYNIESYSFKYKTLSKINFKEEAYLEQHVVIDDCFHDVLIHSYFL